MTENIEGSSGLPRTSTLEELDDAKEKELSRKVEAALFISGKYLSLKELVSLTDVNPLLLRKILDDLIEKYSDSGIEVLKKGDSWKMDVSQEHTDLVNRLATGSTEFSNAEQETLAIIAYKQPVKQSVVIKIRGNKAYDHIKNFVDLNLINKRRLGHTSELTVSDKFYDYFRINKPTLD